MSDETAWFELWSQDYNTFGEGDWYLVAKMRDRGVAKRIMENAGWGTRYEIRGEAPDYKNPEWASLTLEEFDERYIMSYGNPVPRNSEYGRRLEEREAREKELAEERERIRKLPAVGRKGRKLP